MPAVIDQLLFPPRVAARALDDLHRIASGVDAVGALARDCSARSVLRARLSEAVSTLGEMRDEIGGLRRALAPMSDDLDGLREAFEGSNKQLERLREAITPELGGIREAAEPLHHELGRQRESIDTLDVGLREVGELLSARLSALADALGPLEQEMRTYATWWTLCRAPPSASAGSRSGCRAPVAGPEARAGEKGARGAARPRPRGGPVRRASRRD